MSSSVTALRQQSSTMHNSKGNVILTYNTLVELFALVLLICGLHIYFFYYLFIRFLYRPSELGSHNCYMTSGFSLKGGYFCYDSWLKT